MIFKNKRQTRRVCPPFSENQTNQDPATSPTEKSLRKTQCESTSLERSTPLKPQDNGKSEQAPDFGKSFFVYTNRLMEYGKNETASHLVSIADLTSSRASKPLGILITSFGFEQEYINYLFEISKVGKQPLWQLYFYVFFLTKL